MSRIILKIDTRETTKDILENSSVIPADARVIEALDIGDYVFQVDGVPMIIIERKTVNDLAASIKDGRHREQKKRLEANYDKHQVVFLIEGNLQYNNSGYRFNHVDKQTVMSSIFNTMFRDRFHVFHTTGEQDTVHFLESLYTKIVKQTSEFLGFFQKPNVETHEDANEVAEYDVSRTSQLIHQNKPTKSKLISSVKSENTTPKMIFIAQLGVIQGVSDTVAQRISEKHSSMCELISFLKSLDVREKAIEYICDIKTSDVNGRRLAKTTAGYIVDYLGVFHLNN